MRFRYLPIGGSLKPALDVVAICGDQRLATRAIVDSGADFSVFDIQIADHLGIPIDRSAGLTVRGVGGQAVVYPGHLDIELRRHQLNLNVFFATNLPINLLGRDDFFHHFVVQFDEIKHELQLIARRTSSAGQGNR